MGKAFRRLVTVFMVGAVAFRAVGSFLSWIEGQEDSSAEAWIDEDEYEDA